MKKTKGSRNRSPFVLYIIRYSYQFFILNTKVPPFTMSSCVM